MGAYEVKVASIPNCDLWQHGNHAKDEQVPAVYDGATKMGPWANMCSDCFRRFGVGLGIGRGQKLILREPEGDAYADGGTEPGGLDWI